MGIVNGVTLSERLFNSLGAFHSETQHQRRSQKDLCQSRHSRNTSNKLTEHAVLCGHKSKQGHLKDQEHIGQKEAGGEMENLLAHSKDKQQKRIPRYQSVCSPGAILLSTN